MPRRRSGHRLISDTVVLLFSMMLIVAHLRLAGFFELDHRARHPPPAPAPPASDRHRYDRRPCPAFLVNDIVCLMMTPLVVHMTRRAHPPVPYVLAVATASNIGQHRHDHGQPAEHVDWIALRHRHLHFIRDLAPRAAWLSLTR